MRTQHKQHGLIKHDRMAQAVKHITRCERHISPAQTWRCKRDTLHWSIHHVKRLAWTWRTLNLWAGIIYRDAWIQEKVWRVLPFVFFLETYTICFQKQGNKPDTELILKQIHTISYYFDSGILFECDLRGGVVLLCLLMHHRWAFAGPAIDWTTHK